MFILIIKSRDTGLQIIPNLLRFRIFFVLLGLKDGHLKPGSSGHMRHAGHGRSGKPSAMLETQGRNGDTALGPEVYTTS